MQLRTETILATEGIPRDPIWKLDRLGSAGRLFWRRDSGGVINRSGKERVKFNYEVEVLEYLPHESEKNGGVGGGDAESGLSKITATLHVIVVGLVCVAATITTFTWLVQ